MIAHEDSAKRQLFLRSPDAIGETVPAPVGHDGRHQGSHRPASGGREPWNARNLRFCAWRPAFRPELESSVADFRRILMIARGKKGGQRTPQSKFTGLTARGLTPTYARRIRGCYNSSPSPCKAVFSSSSLVSTAVFCSGSRTEVRRNRKALS